MQRKNYFLKPSKHRSAMAMIMAIAAIVVMATIMTLSLSLVTETTKRTTDIYLHEQAILVSKSAAELALLTIAQYAPCTVIPGTSYDYIGSYLFDLNGNGNPDDINFTVDVTPYYVYKDLNCTAPYNFLTTTSLQTDEQNGSVILDITVSSDEGTEPLRYFRRVIQKL